MRQKMVAIIYWKVKQMQVALTVLDGKYQTLRFISKNMFEKSCYKQDLQRQKASLMYFGNVTEENAEE